MKQFSMIIDGQQVASSEQFEVINPASGEPFAQVAMASREDVDNAVAAARAAFPAWSATTSEQRNEMLLKLAAALEANMPEMMELVTLESGKPFGGLDGIGSGMEVGGSMAWIQYTTSLELPVETIQDDDEALVQVYRKPLGVVASITPWNWPLMIAIWHTMPALKAGNTVVIKPSSNTPTSTIRMVELANEILPKGVFNVVTGNSEIGDAIVNHQDINKIVFTGSTPTGKKIMQGSASNLKRLTLELGGNDAGIVLPDVNVDEIVPKLFASIFHNNGQTCAALKRLYVHESQYTQISEGLARLAKNVVVGNGLEETTQLGPVQNESQLKFVKELADDAQDKGGTFLSGGQAEDQPGYFFRPAVVTGLSNGHRLVDEEQFGPIVPIIKYGDIDEAIALANDSENGLGGSIWSSDPAKAAELVKRLECGIAWVNEHGGVQPDAPFGGVKQSGIGVEFGHHGFAEYTSIQTVRVSKK